METIDESYKAWDFVPLGHTEQRDVDSLIEANQWTRYIKIPRIKQPGLIENR